MALKQCGSYLKYPPVSELCIFQASMQTQQNSYLHCKYRGDYVTTFNTIKLLTPPSYIHGYIIECDVTCSNTSVTMVTTNLPTLHVVAALRLFDRRPAKQKH